MPRPKAESPKPYRPAFWTKGLSLSAAQEKKLLAALAGSACLNIRLKKEEQVAQTMLWNVLALVGSYKGVEGLYNHPREESHLAELKQLEKSMKNCLDGLVNLSDISRKDILHGELNLLCYPDEEKLKTGEIQELDKRVRRDLVLDRHDRLEEQLDILPDQLQNVLLVLRQTIKFLTKTASGRRATPRKALQVVIRQLLNIFQTCAAPGSRDNKDDQLEFLKIALKAARIRLPQNLAHYIPNK